MEIRFIGEGRRFRTFVDIGSNDGAYGAYIQKLFDIPRVIAFEPLPLYADTLRERGFELHAVALDAEPGEGQFIVNKYPASSSLRPMTPTTLSEWSGVVEEVKTIPVRKARLDDEIAGVLEGDVLIKVDAQGAETEILQGGQRVFAQAAAIMIETNFVPLYRGEGGFNSIHAALAELGFHLSGFKSQHIGKNGRPLFAHCIYER